MKTFFFLGLVISCFRLHVCFLTYPFSGQILDQILGAANGSHDVNSDDLLRHAIDGSECARKCIKGDHQICRFNFTLRHSQVMGGSCDKCDKGNIDHCRSESCVIADGIGRGFLSINLQLPGPTIQVCKDDIIIVDLYNKAEGLSSTLHWHGLRQFGTQFMDGVPYLTQCPVPFDESFRYSFYASDEGTHFYHSHAGHQKADGVYGALIVRGIEKENPNYDTYDYDMKEHTIVMSDWMQQNAEDSMPGSAKRSSLSQSVLVNGHGRFFNQSTNTSTLAPLTIFHVEADKRFRFRVINAGLNVCPFFMQIENHNFTIISTEVSYVKPLSITTLYFMSGERYDFVIDTHKHECRDYWIRFRQLSPCTQRLEGFAILRYHKKFSSKTKLEPVEFNDRTPPRFEEVYPNGTILNSPLMTGDHLPITSLEDFRHDPKLTDSPPDQSNFIFFDTPEVPMSEVLMKKFLYTTNNLGQNFVATANNITFVYPSFPLLVEPGIVNEKMFCDVDNLRDDQCDTLGGRRICRCLHRIKFKLGSIAELIIVNTDDELSHPIHLHGHKFHVVDTGLLKENMAVSEVKNGSIPKRNLKTPPYKDTVVLPYPGFVRLRFHANNPGYWLLHCHFDWHLPIGMALMVQVGEVEQMRKPPSNFPRCHNYMPTGIV